MQLEYIASGVGHTRVSLSKSANSPEILDYVNKHVLSKIQGVHSHQYGFLFNAYTEKKFGPLFDRFTGLSSKHADSGGLQVVTLGKKLTEELKNSIYEMQGKHSTVAMSFDEIPVVTTEGGSAINDLKYRRFDKENFDDYAKRSGYNLAKQIEYFVENEYTTKPMMIVQGNGLPWFQRWVEVLLKQIPEDMHDKIAGVSIAGTSIGNGLLEAIERAASVRMLPCQSSLKNNVHLLGVGSVVRLFPFALLYQSGFLDKDIHLSYDSTSHTMGMSNGTYITRKGKIRKYGVSNIGVLKEFFDDICGYFPFIESIMSLEDAIESLTTCSTSRSWEYFGTDERVMHYHAFMMAATLSSVANFTRHVQGIFENRKELMRWLTKEKSSALTSLISVKTEDDLQYWLKSAGKNVQSQRLQTEYENARVSLEGLFD